MSLTSCDLSATPARMCSCCASVWLAPPPSKTSLKSGSLRSGDMLPPHRWFLLAHNVIYVKMSRWENCILTQHLHNFNDLFPYFQPSIAKLNQHGLTHNTRRCMTAGPDRLGPVPGATCGAFRRAGLCSRNWSCGLHGMLFTDPKEFKRGVWHSHPGQPPQL